MTDPEHLALAAAIACELDGWEAKPDRYGNPGWAELHGPAGDTVQLRVGPHRIDAHGMHDQDLGRTRHWDVAGYRHAGIGFSTAKTPARMAGEIRRRLLPIVAENNRVLDAEAALIAAGRAADDTLFAAAKLLFPSLCWRDSGNRRRQEAVAWGHGEAVAMEFHLDLWQHDSHSTLTFSHLTRAEMLTLIRAAAALRTAHGPQPSARQRTVHRHAHRRRRAHEQSRSAR